MKKILGLAIVLAISASLQAHAGEVSIPKGQSMYMICDDKSDPQHIVECSFEVSQANEPRTAAQVASGHTPLYALHSDMTEWETLTPFQDNEFSIAQGDKPWKYMVTVNASKMTYSCDNQEADPAYRH